MASRGRHHSMEAHPEEMYMPDAGLPRTPDGLAEVVLGHQTENEVLWVHQTLHVAVELVVNQMR
jgi:hypothetical protein